jgi:hypothetical protein
MKKAEKPKAEPGKMVIDPKAPLQEQMDSFFKKRSRAELRKKVMEAKSSGKAG